MKVQRAIAWVEVGKIALLELEDSMRESRERLFQTERIVNSETLMRRGAYVSNKTRKKLS